MKKTLLSTLLLTISFNVFAGAIKIIETEDCKSKAISAVYYEFKKRSDHTILDLKVRQKSALDSDTLYHFLDVTESETYIQSLITVGLDPKTCKVKVIQ